MIKRIINMFMILSVFGLLFCLISCGEGDNQNNKNNNYTEKEIYIDNNKIDNDTFSLELRSYYCSNTSPNYSLSVSFNITNKTYKTKEFNVKNVSLKKVSTNASYTVYYDDEELSVEAELQDFIIFSATIPSSIDTDEYKLFFEIENLKVTLHLYETPDSLRADRTVSYYIDNVKVHSEVVKDNRKLSNLFTYESSDNLYYCKTWYTDSSYKNKFNESTAITSDISLYGPKLTNIKWVTTTYDTYSIVNSINHIPSSGILRIPSTYLNKEIYIGGYAIKNINVSKIYIPKTVHVINGGNFTGIGNAKIYYEGTMAEWESLFVSPNYIYKTNVFYNTTYSK